MLRKIVVLAGVIGVPLVIVMALRYGKIQSITFREAVQRSETRSESEQAGKVVVTGTLISALQKNAEGATEFYVVDAENQKFRVSYTGNEPVEAVTNQEIAVAGHVHGGSEPYFHASQVIKH